MGKQYYEYYKYMQKTIDIYTKTVCMCVAMRERALYVMCVLGYVKQSDEIASSTAHFL